jgi:hypothetical protein
MFITGVFGEKCLPILTPHNRNKNTVMGRV